MYSDELQDVAKADDDLFPAFLFNPIYNDFGDLYYEKSFVNSELEASVKKLRRRYSDYFEWVEAMEIYQSYMEGLIEKYGGMKTIQNIVEDDMDIEFIPAEPKLKRTRRNKRFIRDGVVPSKIITEYVPETPEELLAIARQTTPDDDTDLSPSDSLEPIPKHIRKSLKAMGHDMDRKNRRQNLYRSTGSNAGTDFIVDFLNKAKTGDYSMSSSTHNENWSLVEEIEEDDRLELIPPELREYENPGGSMIYNGKLVDHRQVQQIEIYKILAREGYDIYGGIGKGMDKKSIKMIRNEIGDDTPLTKKEMKKMKKRSKKEQRMIEKRRDNDRILSDTLLHNKFNLADDGNNLTLRLRDLYRD